MGKKIGIIGGMGTKAGLQLTERIVNHMNGNKDQDFIEFLLHSNSSVPDRTLAILGTGPSPVSELRRSIDIMNYARVDLVVFACITASKFLSEIIPYSNALVVNPIQVLEEHLNNHFPNCKRIGVLATTGSIKAQVFKGLNRQDKFVLYLDNDAQEKMFMTSIYGHEGLKTGTVHHSAIKNIELCIQKLQSLRAEVIIGGCTELSLVRNNIYPEIPYVDVVDVLATAVVHQCSADVQIGFV